VNKTDRMLAIVLRLQSAGNLRAEDLASTFETSKRTIYRDIQALSEAGVPLVAIPGQGYSLAEGYFLPPMSFTSHEAILLLLGADFVADNFDADYQRNAELARDKIRAALPPQLLQEVEKLQSRFRFISHPVGTENQEFLPSLRRAILESRVVEFEYHARTTEQTTRRKAAPCALIYYDGAWSVVAYCYLRQAPRHFRVSRLHNLKLLPERYDCPDDFNLTHETIDNPHVVQVLFEPEAAPWVKEDRYFFIRKKEDTPEGLLVTLELRELREAVGWLLSWGRRARVLEPIELVDMVQAEVQAILARYSS
jgi:predicted DNA-binding transcriptional regulator YafY